MKETGRQELCHHTGALLKQEGREMQSHAWKQMEELQTVINAVKGINSSPYESGCNLATKPPLLEINTFSERA